MELYKAGNRWKRRSDNRFATKAEIAAFTGGGGGGSTSKRRSRKGGSVAKRSSGGGTMGCLLKTEPVTRPRLEDAYDIVDGLLEGLQDLAGSRGGNDVRADAEQLYRLAHPDPEAPAAERRDAKQYAIGQQMAQILGLVAVRKGWTAATWFAVAPAELTLAAPGLPPASPGGGGGGGFVAPAEAVPVVTGGGAPAEGVIDDVGQALGTAIGAGIGTYIAPGPGTVIGGTLGGAFGEWGGQAFMDYIGGETAPTSTRRPYGPLPPPSPIQAEMNFPVDDLASGAGGAE